MLLVSWGVPYVEALACWSTYAAGGSAAEQMVGGRAVTFEQFYVEWAPIWQFQVQLLHLW
eukprot:SAG11_NODE_1731_length_4363_cov_4.183865_6_plen_60_part_00